MVFACRSVCDGDSSTYLRADLFEECYAGRHFLFVGLVGVPMVLAYVLGLPVTAGRRRP